MDRVFRIVNIETGYAFDGEFFRSNFGKVYTTTIPVMFDLGFIEARYPNLMASGAVVVESSAVSLECHLTVNEFVGIPRHNDLS